MIPNQAFRTPGLVHILLTQGKIAIIEERDYDKVKNIRWCAQRGRRTYYAASGESYKRQLMHRVIAGKPGLDVDHRDHDGLNNRRSNLRPATHSQNQMNRQKKQKSIFKGVSLHKPSGKYLCHIANQHLGLFADPEEAAIVYDIAAIALFGRFACTNNSAA